jgi:8-oxo-dGTP diphosphatase
MKHRIRSSAIVIWGDSVLLIKHQDPVTGFEWWVPPGGGLEDGESVYECAIRETYEETGLTVELAQILYLREFVETSKSRHHFEVFILAASFKGEPTLANNSPLDPDYQYIKDAKFLSKQQMRGLTVYPEELKDKFWEDLASGKKLETQYLGQQVE